jgi:Flp pilus assembly protein TadG
MHTFTQQTKRFIRNDDGIATAWAIGWLILCFSIAGLSIDATNAWKVKQILQSTADVAAHAGGLELGTVGNASIKEAVTISANQYASNNMRPARYGDVLVDTDILVGYWDGENKIFTEMVSGDVDIPNAVSVTTRQDGVNSSKVGTFFLRFIGFDAFTVATTSTVESFVSQCEQDGLIARGSVKMSTQQSFLGDFCVYGLSGIDASDQNYFAEGTTAGMLNLDDCGPLPENCTNEYNPGIEEALRQSNMTFGKIDRIAVNIGKLQDPLSDMIPWYIDRTQEVIEIDPKNFDIQTEFISGRIHVVKCTSPGQNVNLGGLANIANNGGNNTDTGAYTIGQSILKSKMVIVGDNCDFDFDESVRFEDAYIATTATGQQTFSGSANVQLGENDGCDEGGEVTLITAGDVNFAAKLDAYDLEIVAAGDVGFASHANDGDSIHKGTNVWAGGDIRVTTKHTFEPCGLGGDTDYEQKFTLRYVE